MAFGEPEPKWLNNLNQRPISMRLDTGMYWQSAMFWELWRLIRDYSDKQGYAISPTPAEDVEKYVIIDRGGFRLFEHSSFIVCVNWILEQIARPKSDVPTLATHGIHALPFPGPGSEAGSEDDPPLPSFGSILNGTRFKEK